MSEFEKEFWKSFEEGIDEETSRSITRHGAAETGVHELAREQTERIAQQLAVLGPRGWTRVWAAFSLAGGRALTEVAFTVGGRTVGVDPLPVLPLVVELRRLSARLSDGPWWRFTLDLTAQGRLETGFDYGDETFPEGQLLPAECYKADLETFPRRDVPGWMRLYMGWVA